MSTPPGALRTTPADKAARLQIKRTLCWLGLPDRAHCWRLLEYTPVCWAGTAVQQRRQTPRHRTAHAPHLCRSAMCARSSGICSGCWEGITERGGCAVGAQHWVM